MNSPNNCCTTLRGSHTTSCSITTREVGVARPRGRGSFLDEHGVGCSVPASSSQHQQISMVCSTVWPPQPQRQQCAFDIRAVFCEERTLRHGRCGCVCVCVTKTVKFICTVQNYQVSELDMQEFRHIVGERMIVDENELEGYNTDWLHIVR